MKEIKIYGVIYSIVNEIVKEIGEEKELRVRINSNGGDIFEAQTIYNLLKERETEIIIDGVSASAATLIACAGKKVTMAENGLYMIHNPMTWFDGYVGLEELKKRTEMLEKVKETMIKVYAKKSGKSEEEISGMMNEGKYMTAPEAKENGFVDEISGAVTIEAKGEHLFVNSVQADELKKYYPQAVLEAEIEEKAQMKAAAIIDEWKKKNEPEKMNYYAAMREDIKNSGASKVKGMSQTVAREIDEVVKYMNEMSGVR